MYRIALNRKKIWTRSAIKAQQILKTLVRNATYAIAEVALCSSLLTTIRKFCNNNATRVGWASKLNVKYSILNNKFCKVKVAGI